MATYLPFNMVMNITSDNIDYLNDMESNSLIEVFDVGYTKYLDDYGYDRWNITQKITFKPDLTQNMCDIADNVRIGCHIEHLYREEQLLSTEVKPISITCKYLPWYMIVHNN